VYDLTDPTSVDDLEEWISDAANKTREDPDITYVLIGNKRDAVVEDAISNAGEMFSLKHGISEHLQFKVSALTDSLDYLKDIFMTIAQNIYATQTNNNPENTTGNTVEEPLILSSNRKKKQCYKC